MLKRLLVIAAGLASASNVCAYDLKFAGTDYGKLIGVAKAMTILSAEDNGWDPSTGTSYSVMGKYISPSFDGFRLTAAAYLNGDLFGLTDFEPDPDERTARGMFVADEGQHKGQLTEINLTFKSKQLYAFAGRAPLDTPLTKITYNHVPNSYTALQVGAKPFAGWDLSLGQITQMSFGSRAMTDWGLIGEGTGTGGTSQQPNRRGLGQVKFLSTSEIALGPTARSTSGITAFSLGYSGLPYDTKLQLWNYFVHDISNDLYFDASAKVPIKDLKLELGFQWLHQDDVGDGPKGITGPVALRANFGSGELDFDMIGLKAGLVGKKWSFHGVYNSSSGDTAYLNSYGGDPAYTSTIFSRNAYRQDVDAWGLRFKYKIMKGLVFSAQYVDYGKSETLGVIPGFTQAAEPTSDASEWDLVLTWKPKQLKGLVVRTFYANRTSEYDDFMRPDGRKADATMSHWRLILAYKL